MKRAILLSCLALAGCFSPGKRGGDANLAVYDLGPAVAGQPAAAATPPLAVEVRAPSWLDSPGIRYRLAYAEPGRLLSYAQARWVASPAALVQQRLAQQLGLTPVGQGGAACLLRVDLDEFSHIFSSPRDSLGVLQARAAVFDRSRSKLAEQVVKIEKPASSPDSQGGRLALAEAVAQLGSDLGRWQAELAGSGRLKDCETAPRRK